MSAVAAKDTASAETPAPKSQLPKVDPSAVQENYTGQAFRSMFARLPLGIVANDLSDPSIWSRVQSSRRCSLRTFDHLFIVAADQSWSVDTVVIDADELKAVLFVQRIITMGERFDKLPEDDRFYGRWNAVSYELVRRSDGHVVARAANIPLLWRELAQQYPRPLQ